MAKLEKTHLGVGLYSIADASRILRIHPSSVFRWTHPKHGVVPRYFDPAERTLTFVELMELHFIKIFRQEGVSLQTIRKASAAAAKKYKSDYPLCVKRFDTNGKAIFATLVKEETKEEVVEELRHGQLVFQQIVKPFFRKIEYGNTIEPARFWPLEKSGRIVLDPARKFGKPVDAETGIPTRVIFDASQAGQGRTAVAVAKWFNIPLPAVEAAIEFERSMAA